LSSSSPLFAAMTLLFKLHFAKLNNIGDIC
jgi:hypothetical protein